MSRDEKMLLKEKSLDSIAVAGKTTRAKSTTIGSLESKETTSGGHQQQQQYKRSSGRVVHPPFVVVKVTIVVETPTTDVRALAE